MKRKIAAIVVTYNRKEMLIQNIEALLNQTYEDMDILIIDNGSSDGTYEFIYNFIDNQKIHYQNTQRNLGGAGGFNYGIKEAIKGEYEYIWLMDDDCLPNEKCLEKLINADEELEGRYGFLSSVTYWKDGKLCNMNIQKVSLYKKLKECDERFSPVIMASFVSLFMKTETVIEMGLPIKEFFIWADDLEYTRRISRKYPSYVVNNSNVIHDTNSNTGSNIAIDDARIERYRYAYRNEFYVARKEGVNGILYQLCKILYHIAKVLCSKNVNKWRKMKIIISSSYRGIFFNPKIEFIQVKTSGRKSCI